MAEVLDLVKNTTEPLASLEYNVRAAFKCLAGGGRAGLVYLLAAISILEETARQEAEKS